MIFTDIFKRRKNMQTEGVLIQLGYVPNDALVKQLQKIELNTQGYEKIQKHIMDLHEHLKVNDAYVAMSNSNDCFKIKIESQSPEMAEEAAEKVKHFSEKYKVAVDKLQNKNTYYIIGFDAKVS
jgi:acetolactate synthase small subunit